MKLALGLYTQVSSNAPTPVFQRALSCIIKPVFTFIHNNPEARISYVQTSAFINYFSQHYPEVNLLIQNLAKNDRLELLTSSWNMSLLPITQMKDRSNAIEKTTLLIRKTYNYRASTLWCYGEIWSPSIVSAMKIADINRLLISSYDAINRKSISQSPFMMNELSKKIGVLPTMDECSKLISQYAQNEISFDSLSSSLVSLVRNASEDSTLVYTINIDQLCQGASYNREDDQRLGSLVISLLNETIARGGTLSLMKEIEFEKNGYLDSGWYGRDVHAGGLKCFHDLFVNNESYRYMLLRTLALLELNQNSKKDKVLKKSVQTLLAGLPSGTLFLCDSYASCLRLSEHRAFYRNLLEAEEMLRSQDIVPYSYDLDDDGYDEEFCYGRVNSAVFTCRGASVYEFNLLERGINIMDTVSPWVKSPEPSRKEKSFRTVLDFDGVEYDLGDCVFFVECIGKNRNEFNFVLDDDRFPFTISKHYKLTNQNLYLSVVITNRSGKNVKVVANEDVFFTLPSSSAFSYDSNRELLVGSGLNNVKYVRFKDEAKELMLSFLSSESFDFHEEVKSQSEVTSLGSELFYLYTKARMSFKLDIAPSLAESYSITTKITSTKEK